MLVVGLTGGIACGKSSVSKYVSEEFEDQIAIVDADLIAREIVEPGKPAYNKIVSYFKDKIPGLVDTENNNVLNRPKLGAYVFSNKKELKKLNSITHPQVRFEIFKKIVLSYLKGYRMCMLDVPLLFEAKLDIFCGKTVSVVTGEQSLQVERLMKRNGFTSDEAMSRINSQMSTEERIHRSSYIIENNGTMEELKTQVTSIFGNVLKPSFTQYLLELFPPFGICSALNVIIINYFNRNVKTDSFKKLE